MVFLHPLWSSWKCGGLFQVIDGKVVDDENYFGLGTRPDEETFNQNLRDIIKEINSWVDKPLSSNLPDEDNDINLYPNPSSNNLNISFNIEPNGKSTSIIIFDQFGREVIKQTVLNVLSKGVQNIRINTSLLTPGIYFLRIRSGGSVETRKFVVVR